METEIFAWIFALIAYAMIGIAIVEVYKAVFDDGIESREALAAAALWPICTALFFLGCVLRLIKRAWKGARTDDSKIQTKRNDRYVSLSARATGAIKGAVLLPTRWP